MSITLRTKLDFAVHYTMRHALSLAEPDDLVVICADEITAVWKEDINYKPHQVPVGTGRVAR